MELLKAITNNQYAKLAERTLSYGFYFNSQGTKNMLHGAIGLTTEAGELIRAMDLPPYKKYVNIVEELGDIFWYIAIFEREVGIELVSKITFGQGLLGADNSLIESQLVYKKITPLTTEILDLYKKRGFYDREVDTVKLQNKLENLNDSCYMLASVIGVTVEEIKLRNINKLIVRFPDKFTNENAVFRNLDAEMKTLT